MTDPLNRSELRRGDVRLSSLSGGSGGLGGVVLLHGLAGSAAELGQLAKTLCEDGHHVVALDQRGHGHSTRRPQDLSRQAYVDDVVAVIGAVGGGAALVGQSMGAQTAMLVAAARPDLVRGLVMIEGGVGGSEDDYPARLGAWFASWPVPFADDAAATEFLGSTPMGAAWVRDLERRADGLWPRFDADVMETAIRAVADAARWPEWETLTVPTLMIAGERGNQDERERRRMLELRPDVKHIVVRDAGHDVHLDQPAICAALVRDFLRVSGG
jgi:pimeloyl-ACP methyl ester carboxylesterase